MTLLLAATVLIQMPAVQNFAVQKVMSALSSGMKGEISVGKVQLLPFKTVVIKDFLLLDDDPHECRAFHAQDTVAYIGEAVVSFSLKNLLDKECLTVNKVTVRNGVANMIVEGEHKNNFKRLLSKGDPHPMEDKGEVFFIDKIKADNVRYRMHNVKDEYDNIDNGIDWYDLDATVVSLKAHALHLCNACIYGTLDEAEITEKSGYAATLSDISTEIRSGKVLIKNINLVDEWSDLHLDKFMMTYDNGRSFRDFTHKVALNGEISDSKVNLRTLGYFASSLYGKELELDVSKAMIAGTVDNMSITDLVAREPAGTSVSLAASWRGLLDGKPAVNADVRSLSFTTSGISSILASMAPGMKLDLSRYAPKESFNFRGKASGPGDNLKVHGTLTSTAGAAEASLSVRNLIGSARPLELAGSVSTDNLDIGRLAGIDLVRQCTMRTSVSATLGSAPALKVDTLSVSRLSILGYDYTGLAAAGKFSGSEFDGRVICNDPNLNFMFQGLFNLSKKTNNASYKFFFNLGYADLNELHIDKRGTSKASLSMNANFKRIRKGDIIGDVNVRGIKLENDEGMHDIGNVTISSHTSDDITRMGITSSFAEGAYVGTKPVTAIANAVMETTVKRQFPALAGKAGKWDGDSYRVSLKVIDMRDLLSFVLPGLYIAEGTSLKATVTSEGRFTADMSSQRLAFGDKFIKDLRLNIPDIADTITLSSSEINVSGVKMMDGVVKLHAADNHADLSGHFDNHAEATSKGDIHLTADFARDRRDSLIVDICAMPSEVYARGEKWQIRPSDVHMVGKDIRVGALEISSGAQSISAQGGWSKSHADTLNLDVSHIEISSLTRLLGKNIDVAGRLTGDAEIYSSADQTGLYMDARCDSAVVSGVYAGDIMVKTGWDQEEKRLAFSLTNAMEERSTIEARGSFYPDGKRINAKLSLDDFDLGYARSFVSSFLSEIGGKLKGEITMAGPFNDLSVFSRGVELEDAMLRIAYTDVPYYLNGPLHINDSGIVFDDIAITDGLNGKGVVTGGVSFQKLRNMRMDMKILARRLKLYAAKEESSSAVYGDITGTGLITLSGPFNGLTLDVDARTDGQGNLHVPLGKFSSAGSTSLLTFKQPAVEVREDPYEAMMRSRKTSKKDQGHFDIRMKVDVQPEVECSIEIDKENGNVLKGNGYGSIAMDILHSKPFNIAGDYSLNSGNFHFNAMGIAHRNFTISSGSSIKFGGDIMNSDLDITANYVTKTSLSNLIADTVSVSTRRTVDCGLSITEKLRNPKLGFSIDIPDLDPSTKSLVESALNTDDKLQKQFIALLVTGNFLPGDESGIVNNSNILFSNVSEIMAGQLNNILERLGIPLDLGLKYQPNEDGTDIFDVAVSTQLFNNRVTVNGSVGNRQYGTSGSTEDVAGDIDIEVKLDKAGAVRLSAFSHSADQYTNYLDNTQRNGIGIGYQKEFNSFKDLFRKKVTPAEAVRNASEDRPRARRRRSQRCVIEIESDE